MLYGRKGEKPAGGAEENQKPGTGGDSHSTRRGMHIGEVKRADGCG